MGPTRNGVFHNLSESPFSYTDCGMTFWFSSQRHLDRFRDQLVARQVAMSATMSKRVGCEVDMSSLAALQLYRQVETFGFMVTVEFEAPSADGASQRYHVAATSMDSLKFSYPPVEVA